MDGILGERDVLGVCQKAGHDLGSLRSPRSVLDDCHCPVLIVALGQMLYERAHEREDIGIVCG